MNCPQSLTNKMRLSYILMGDTDSDDFKTVALYLTYRTIEQKPNVTMIQLVSYLQHFGLKADVVEKSVAMLAGIHTIGEGCRFLRLIALKGWKWIKEKSKDIIEFSEILNSYVFVKNAKV